MAQRWSHVPEQVADECEARQVPGDGRPVARTGHEDLVAGRGGQTVCPQRCCRTVNCFLPSSQTVTTVLAPPVRQTQVRISWWWNGVSPCGPRAVSAP